VLAIAVLSTRYSLPLIDDVHITLRHSLNFAAGNGLVYNRGERLLGATSPIYALLLGVLVPIFSNPVAAAIYVWPLALAVAALFVYQMSGRGPIGLAAAVVLCTDPQLLPVVGMETTFYVAVLFAIIALFERERLPLTAFLLGLLPMIRPDGVFLIAAVVIVWLVDNRASLNRAFAVRHARLLGLFLVPLVIWCVFATAYYGQPLPNSFVAKYHQSKVTWWWTDALTFRRTFGERLEVPRYQWLAIAGCAGAALALFRKDRVLRVGSLFTVFYVTAFVVSRVPNYPNYFIPPFAMMTLVGARGLGVLFELIASRAGIERSKSWFVRARAGATAAVGLGSLVVVGRGSDLRLFEPLGAPNPQMAYVQIGRYLKANVPPDASVAAMEIGIIGYYSGSKIVDFAGLVSPGVMPAVASGQRRYVLDTFHPDYVVARYPIPQALEGGLTESELAADYQFLFGASGVGVFRALRPPKGGHWDVSGDAERLNGYPGTVFIAKEYMDPDERDALDHAVAPHGSLFVRSLAGDARDVSLKRYAYASFREGHLNAIEPLSEASDVPVLSQLPDFEFDSPSERFGEWHDVTVRGPEESMLHVTTRSVDGYLSVPITPFAPWFAGTARIRMRVTRFTGCQNGGREGFIFWVTDRDETWGARDKSAPFSVPTDGEWHEIVIELRDRAAWNGSGIITNLRYDPLHCLADVDVDYFRIE
jgi:hypothetical protein